MKKSNSKITKIIKTILLILLALIIIAIAGTGFMFRDEIKIISSIEKKASGNQNYYVMDFDDGYKLDDVIDQDISSDSELAAILSGYISHGFYKPESTAENHVGCSTITTVDEEGNLVWGRNFDWYKTCPIIVRATPEDGYASISTCEFSNITGNTDSKPEDMPNKFLAVASYYVPMDGVNEKGLCVAHLEVNEGGQELVDTEKKNITVTMATRLLLDRAATVDEALALLDKYDIAPSGGISSHLSIADATGRSVVVEFMDGKIEVVETPVVTNFNIKNGDIAAGGESAMNRYNTLVDRNNEAEGIMTKDQVKDSIQAASQTSGKWKTRWSLVYENAGKTGVDNLKVTYYWNGDYKKPIEITM